MATIIVAEREMSKSETQNILYAISETPIWIEYKTKTIVGVKSNRNAKPKAHRFQLLNWATIKADGTIRQASHEFYDTKFKTELNMFRSNNEALLFLDYHFENTHYKRELLNRIDTHIIRRYITNHITDVLLNENRIELVAGWLREKKKELPKEKTVGGFEVPQIALAIGVTRLFRTGHHHEMNPTETYKHFSKYGGTPGSITKAMTEKDFRKLREDNNNITAIMRDKAREIIVLEGSCKVCLQYLDSYKITSE